MFPRDYTDETLQAIALEAKRLFKVDDVPIIFVDMIPDWLEARGLYRLDIKTIYIRKVGSILKMIETLMHEIVHAKQHKMGILGAYRGHILFMGKLVRDGEYTYETQPWEIQANKHMGPMFDQFCREANISLLQTIRANEVRYQQRIA